MRLLAKAAALAIALAATSAVAMPNFARKEGFTCGVCHTAIPRLNRTGFEYRNAGFRQPTKLGEPGMPDEFGQMNTARIQGQIQWARQETAAGVTARGQISFVEATLYPVSGAFGRWWSSLAELSVAPEDFFEVENGYLRGTFGDATHHGNLRAGVFHPFEGYGASDRPLALARPLFQTTAARTASAGGSTFFTPWGFDEAGIEAGYTFGSFNVSVALLNGILVRSENDALAAFPFQGGELVRASSDPNFNAKDYEIFANQFFGDAALSAYYYHGTVSIPPSATAADFYTDNFDRLALYGTLPMAQRLWLMAGAQVGWDSKFETTAGATNGTFNSYGFFAEGFVPWTHELGGTVRYDWFDPATDTDSNSIQTITLAGSYALLNGAQAILEYQLRLAETAARLNNTNQLRLRLIMIF